MPRKIKPRYGFENIIDATPIKKADVKSILKELGIIPKEHTVSQLMEATSRYLSTKEVVNNPVSPAEAKAALREIQDTSTAFLKAYKLKKILNQLDSTSRNLLGDNLKNRGLDWLIGLQASLTDLIPDKIAIEKVKLLNAAAEMAFKDISKGKIGRPSGVIALDAYIWNLADIYEFATGVEATITSNPYAKNTEEYSGNFYEFVEAFIKEFGRSDFFSNSALGQRIKEVRKQRKRAKDISNRKNFEKVNEAKDKFTKAVEDCIHGRITKGEFNKSYSSFLGIIKTSKKTPSV